MVHNHGPEEGEGLDCPETQRLDGSLKGACLPPSDYELAYRYPVLFNVWGQSQ